MWEGVGGTFGFLSRGSKGAKFLILSLELRLVDQWMHVWAPLFVAVPVLVVLAGCFVCG